LPFGVLLDELAQYLQSIAKFHELSEDEERVLIEKAQAGDILSRNKVLEANLAFVVKVAQHYQNKGADILDLISIGNLSLILAIGKYDIKKRTRFRNYAFFYIKKNIIIELSSNGKLLPVSADLQQIARKIKRARQRLYAQFGTEPSYLQISKELDLSQDTIIKVIEEIDSYAPLDISVQDFEKTSLFSYNDFIDVEIDDSLTLLIRERIQRAFESTINNLNPQESLILKSYHGLDGYPKKSFLKIAKDIDKDQETVSKLYFAILNKIRKEVIEVNLDLMRVIDVC